MEYENEEDEIVEEIPVFLSKNLQDNLYLFQYPTKTQVSNFETADVVKCCVKPLNQQVMVDFALDTESQFYDRFKGEQFALAANGKSQAKDDRPTFKRGLMDKQTFVGSTLLDDGSKYIVGICGDKEIHLSPLTAILQLQPTFSYFNKNEQKVLDNEDDNEEFKAIKVKFAKPNNKNVKVREGYDTFIKKSEDEPWCETYWHSRTSHVADLERQKLFAANRQKSHALSLETLKYIEKVLPAVGQDQGIDAGVPSGVMSKVKLKSLSLLEQLKVILKDAKMLSFDEIMSILHEIQNPNPKNAVDKVLRALPQVGILIHGNWVPQSEILYPNETLSNKNGIKSEQMIRARDYVLFRFSRTNSLYRSQVISATQLPCDEGTEVLESVAKLNSDGKWILLLQPDTKFEESNPDLVQRQDMVWRATEQIYNEMDCEKSPKRPRKRSQRESRTYSMMID